MKLKRSFINTSQNIKIALYDFGDSGKPVIFSHFTGGIGKLWAPVIKFLTPYFHCFSYDARGHGNSSKPKDFSAYSWDNHLNDLISIVETIKNITGESEFYGVGHSFGGALITQIVLATKSIINWQRIILIEPIIAPQTIDIKKVDMSNIAKKRKGIFESVELLRKNLSVKNPYQNWSRESWKIYEKYGFTKTKSGKFKLKCPPDIESYQYLHANPPGWFENLLKIKIPVLLIYGENSDLLPIADFQLKQFREGYLIKIPNVGHFLPQETPELLSNWILKWFEVSNLT